MLLGSRPQDVLNLIAQRKAVGHRKDNNKLAVVVEGGAMRGIYTAGSLLGLDLMACNDVFDAAYGTSAGAVNAAHFLSKTGADKTATYYRALCDGRFYNPWRIWNPVDIDFFLNKVLREAYPLALEAAQKSATPLYVTLMDFETGVASYPSLQEAGTEAWTVLNAAVAMPVLYRKPVFFQGRRYLDGGLAAPYPLMKALEDGCTHILVLVSRDITRPPRTRSAYHRFLFQTFAALGNANLMRVFDQWTETLAKIDRMSSVDEGTAGDAAIATFSPSPQHVSSSTMENTVIRGAGLQMTAEVLDAFSHPHESFESLKSTSVL